MTLQTSALAPPMAPPLGACPLTPREVMVLAGLAEGLTNEELAARFRTSTQTVKNQVALLLSKLAAPNRTAAVVIALQQKWIRLSGVRVRRRAAQAARNGS